MMKDDSDALWRGPTGNINSWIDVEEMMDFLPSTQRAMAAAQSVCAAWRQLSWLAMPFMGKLFSCERECCVHAMPVVEDCGTHFEIFVDKNRTDTFPDNIAAHIVRRRSPRPMQTFWKKQQSCHQLWLRNGLRPLRRVLDRRYHLDRGVNVNLLVESTADGNVNIVSAVCKEFTARLAQQSTNPFCTPRLVRLDLRLNGEWLLGRDASLLTSQPFLKTLRLSGCRVAPDALPHLSKSASLETLSIASAHVGSLPDRLPPTLKVLALEDLSDDLTEDTKLGTCIPMGCLSSAKATSLESLTITACRGISVSRLHLAPSVKVLALDSFLVDHEVFGLLDRAQGIETLTISACNMHSGALFPSSARSLKKLSLAECRINDATLRSIAALPSLTEFCWVPLSGAFAAGQVSAEGFRAFGPTKVHIIIRQAPRDRRQHEEVRRSMDTIASQIPGLRMAFD